MRIDKWNRLNSRDIADCRVFRVREDACESEMTGVQANFFVIENPDWVNVIPVTLDGQVVLIEQYRHGIEQIALEIPGGMIDPEETPEKCARRELEEETGYVAGQLIFLGRSNPNPAIQTNWIYHFVGLECEPKGETAFDEHESISNRVVSFNEIERLISDEEITHSLVVAGFQRYAAFLKRRKNHVYES